jgi:hypothetical protein
LGLIIPKNIPSNPSKATAAGSIEVANDLSFGNHETRVQPMLERRIGLKHAKRRFFNRHGRAYQKKGSAADTE